MGIGNRLSSQPDYISYAKYMSSNFFMSQKLFYDYVLQEETSNPNAEINAIIYEKWTTGNKNTLATIKVVMKEGKWLVDDISLLSTE